MTDQTSPIYTSRGVWPWILAFAAVVLVAALGSAFPPDEWFEALAKPTWQPPNWLFAPVWGSLYVMMACSLALLIRSPSGPMRTEAISWFIGQLILNAAWTPVFFGLRAPLLALVTISVLWLVLIGSIVSAMRVNSIAAWLQVPTIAWVSFALELNAVIVAMNP